MKKLIALIALSIALAACGVKGDPQAPGTQHSQPVQQTQQ